MIAIYFEHFFEPLIGRQTFLKAYLTAQKSCVKLLSNYLRAQKSGFDLLSAFLSEFFFLSALLSTQKHTQGTSEPLCDKWQNRVDALPRHRKYFIQNRVDPLSSLLNTHLRCQSCAYCIIIKVLQSSWLYLCGMMLIHLRTVREIYFLFTSKISHQGSHLVPEFNSSQKVLVRSPH